MASVNKALGAVRGGTAIPLWVRARAHTEDALNVLVNIMRDDSAPQAVRAVCADKVLDRAWGKAPLVVMGDAERPIKVDVRSLNVNVIAGLEDALMRALGEGIQDAIHSQTPDIIEGTSIPAEGDPAVLGLPEANEYYQSTQRSVVGAESPDLARLNALGDMPVGLSASDAEGET